MIITKKSPSATDAPARNGGDGSPSAAGRDGPGNDGCGLDTGPSGPPARLYLYPDGIGHQAVDSSGPRFPARAFANPAVARAAQGSHLGPDQHGAQECVPRHACDIQFRLPQLREGEADRELRLLSRHDCRPDRGQGNRPGNAAPVARTRHGPARGRGAMRRRLRLRLPKQSFLVLAHHSPPLRGTSTQGVRPSVRRGHSRGKSEDAEEEGKPAGSRPNRCCAPAARAGVRRPQEGGPVPRQRAGGGAPHPKLRKRAWPRIRIRTSNGLSACLPPTPTTSGSCSTCRCWHCRRTSQG